MAVSRPIFTILLTFTWACSIACTLEAQEVPVPQLTPGSERKPASASGNPVQSAPPQTVALTVAKGAPLQVALDEEVRAQKVGQPVQARTVTPGYRFDHLLVP